MLLKGIVYATWQLKGNFTTEITFIGIVGGHILPIVSLVKQTLWLILCYKFSQSYVLSVHVENKKIECLGLMKPTKTFYLIQSLQQLSYSIKRYYFRKYGRESDGTF